VCVGGSVLPFFGRAVATAAATITSRTGASAANAATSTPAFHTPRRQRRNMGGRRRETDGGERRHHCIGAPLPPPVL